jgi:hypothetical protein
MILGEGKKTQSLFMMMIILLKYNKKDEDRGYKVSC